MNDDDDRAFVDAARRWWHPVARSVDVVADAPIAVELLTEELVVFRTTEGDIGVLDDLCAHRGTRLSAGAVTNDGCVRCPYHAWEYAVDGRCTRIPQAPGLPIPAKAAVPAYRAADVGGLVWTCLVDKADELGPVPTFPEASLADWHVYAGDPMDWRCQAPRQVENFLDIAHFSVLHADTFGNTDVLEMDTYRTIASDDHRSITAHYDYPARLPMPDGNGDRADVVLSFDYEVTLPFTVRLVTSAEGAPYTLWCTSSPVSATRSRVFWVMAAPEDQRLPDELVEAGERAIFYPDRSVVEGQRPERLPLDLAAELHLPFDRLAVAYRRALAGLGFPVLGARV